jgi:hypothetical protein
MEDGMMKNWRDDYEGSYEPDAWFSEGAPQDITPETTDEELEAIAVSEEEYAGPKINILGLREYLQNERQRLRDDEV